MNTPDDSLVRYADMFSAMGTEPRLRIIRLLLAAHPGGMNVGAIQAELGMAASTLSHHLEKLKHEDLVTVQRQGTFLRYTANVETLQDLLTFLYSECCTRIQELSPCFVLPGQKPATACCPPGDTSPDWQPWAAPRCK